MKKILKITIILVILMILYFSYSYYNFKNNILVTENKIINIKTWYTTKDLAKELDINYYFLKNYINNKKWFNLLAWRFEIQKDSNIDEILKSLETPLPDKEVKITTLEWWNIYDIDEYLYKKKLIEKGQYIKYVKNPEKIKALAEFYEFLDEDLINLEWFLYPDTYNLKYPLKINELVIKQLNTFETKVYENILKQKSLTNDDIYDLINLASIVEKEEKNDNYKPIVAWILKKRLNAYWPLWADATVCYPHKLTSEQCKIVISKYIKDKSEYNTRTMIWLPKTPITNPSDTTINATLNDKKTKYWFYLHNIKTWKIYYAETNAEHEANKKYMR